MRKLILCAISIAMFSLFSGQLLAGGVEDCDTELKNNPDAPNGLYGLCIAFWSSESGRGQERVRELYVKKALAAGFDTEIPGDGGDTTPCPCWADENILLDAACSHTLTDSVLGTPVEIAEFDGGLILFQANDFWSATGGCIYTNSSDEFDSLLLPTSSEENLICRAGVNALANGDFDDLCP